MNEPEPRPAVWQSEQNYEAPLSVSPFTEPELEPVPNIGGLFCPLAVAVVVLGVLVWTALAVWLAARWMP